MCTLAESSVCLDIQHPTIVIAWPNPITDPTATFKKINGTGIIPFYLLNDLKRENLFVSSGTSEKINSRLVEAQNKQRNLSLCLIGACLLNGASCVLFYFHFHSFRPRTKFICTFRIWNSVLHAHGSGVVSATCFGLKKNVFCLANTESQEFRWLAKEKWWIEALMTSLKLLAFYGFAIR